LKLTIIPI
jgi:phosphatidylinositol glycan class F